MQVYVVNLIPWAVMSNKSITGKKRNTAFVEDLQYMSLG